MEVRVPLLLLLLAGILLAVGCTSSGSGQDLRNAASVMAMGKNQLATLNLDAKDLHNESYKVTAARSRYEEAIGIIDRIRTDRESEKQDITLLRKTCVYNLMVLDALDNYISLLEDYRLMQMEGDANIYDGAQVSAENALTSAKRSDEMFEVALALDKDIRSSGLRSPDQPEFTTDRLEIAPSGTISQLRLYTREVIPLLEAHILFYQGRIAMKQGDISRAGNDMATAKTYYAQAGVRFQDADTKYSAITGGNFSQPARSFQSIARSWMNYLSWFR